MSRRTESLFVHQLRERQTLDGKLALAAEALQDAASRFDAELVETLAAELKPFYRDLSDWVESQPATASGMPDAAATQDIVVMPGGSATNPVAPPTAFMVPIPDAGIGATSVEPDAASGLAGSGKEASRAPPDA